MGQATFAVDADRVDIVRAIADEVAKLVGVTPPRVTALPWNDDRMIIIPFGRDDDLDVIHDELLPTYVGEWEWEGDIPKFTDDWVRRHFYGLTVLSTRDTIKIADL